MQSEVFFLILVVVGVILPLSVILLFGTVLGWASRVVKQIESGLEKYGVQPPELLGPEYKWYLLYLRTPQRYSFGVRSVVFLSGVLVGYAVSLSAPIYGVKTILGIYPPAIVIFSAIGLFFAYLLRIEKDLS